MRRIGLAAGIAGVLLMVTALPQVAAADPSPSATPSAGEDSGSVAPSPPTATPRSSGPSPSSSPAPTATVICSPRPSAGAPAPAPSGIAECGPVPSAGPVAPGGEEVVQDISNAFPGAADDSREDASASLVRRVPASRPRTRELLQEKSVLPESLKKGWFGPEGWVLPESQGTVRLKVSKDRAVTKGHAAGPGLREYEGGEPGTRTILQQLPGKTVRIYKVIDEHQGDRGRPTELQFHFERGCKGGGWFSSAQVCSTEYCTGGHWWSDDDEKCYEDWLLSDAYSYLGHRGILLINPNEPSDVIAEGRPVGFLTEPVARDAKRRPVPVDWRVTGDTVELRVQDPPGTAYPVVVDPQWFVGRWLARGALVAAGPNAQLALLAIGCAAGSLLTWPETVGQPWYQRVWITALGCLQAL
jgi:hypothetical protein